MRTFYLAGAFERKNEIEVYATILRTMGHTVNSTWLEDTQMQIAEYLKAHPDVGMKLAMRDLHDIMRSMEIVIFTGEMGRGGHQVEMGAALAWGLRVVVVGPQVNLFCLLANERYVTWAEFEKGELGISEEGEEED
jgi:hypothetical protein